MKSGRRQLIILNVYMEKEKPIGQYLGNIEFYQPPRPLADIDADIRGLESEILQMLSDITGSADANLKK